MYNVCRYGKSAGRPTERGLHEDAESALWFAQTSLGIDTARRLIVYGCSLGGAVAIRLAAAFPAKVIVEMGSC